MPLTFEFGLIGNYITAVFGAMAFALAYSHGIIRERELLLLLSTPAIANLFAYLLDINLTETVYQIDSEQASSRFSGFLGNSNLLATALALPPFIHVLFTSSRALPVSASHIVTNIAILAFGVAVTGSRKSLLFFAVYFITITLIYIYSRIASNRSLVTLLLSTIGILILYSQIGEIVDFDEIHSINRLVLAFDRGGEESLNERRLLIEKGPDLFLDAPIFGHGMGQFRELSGMGVYSHNNFIEVLVNQGLIGICLYYGLLAHAIYIIFRRSRTLLPVFCLPIIIFSTDMTGVSYLDRNSQIVYLLVLCVAYARRDRSHSIARMT
ncbi:MAG: O-antigen ligase family protein [Candidatus Accumulibacter sp.]|nr:O-antigen ligase family protein [Candidatus Accumulibacter necessarius]